MYRINKLIQTGRNVFFAKDIAFLWQIKNKNTLYTTLKRYVKKNLLYRLKKGVYSLKPKEKLSSLELASSFIDSYHYLSTETVLQKHGIIFQSSNQITFISDKSMKIVFGDLTIRVRKMKEEFLYNQTGIIKENNILIADRERAIADMLYFNKNYYFDNKNINWSLVKQYQKLIGYVK